MIQSQLVQDRRVEIMDVDPVVDGLETEVVRFSVGHAPLDASARHPHRETIMVMVPAVAVFGCRCSSEFTAPDDQSFLQHPSPLQILEQCCDGLVDVLTQVLHLIIVVVVSIPGLTISVVDLSKAYPPFGKPAGQQASVGEVG